MRKFLFSLLIVLAIPAICLAAADSSRSAAVGGDVEQVVGIGDGSSGYMLEINSNTGAALVADRATAVSSGNVSALVYTGACRLQSIQIYGPTAGDSAMVYDAVTATGTPKFDPAISANTSSATVDCKGAPFTTGIYVTLTDADVFYSIVYDY